jgi:hypothetical protein
LLGQTLALDGGLRVRLRLARFSDAAAIRALNGRHGASPGLRAERLVQFDPRRRYVVCATALIDSTEQLVGLGAIDLDAQAADAPDLLISDPRAGDAVAHLLWRCLVDARAAARSRAA